MIRILKYKSSFTDYSNELNTYKTLTALIDLESDSTLYIGQRYPFNGLSFKFDTVNDQASVLSIQYWDGSNWRSVVETSDGTSNSGATFGKDGDITWVPNKNYRWNYDDTVKTDGTTQITNMGDVTIYDQYWVKFTFSGNLKATTALKWVGNLFCSDNDLFAEHPVLNNTDFLTSIESTKTDYEEQRVIASKDVINDLIQREIIVHQGQILDRDKLRLMTVSQTAYIIYKMLGTDYNDERDLAQKDFNNRRNLKIYNVDKDKDGRLDNHEILRSTSLSRR